MQVRGAPEQRGQGLRESLILQIAREVTANPEHKNLKRREARRIACLAEHRGIKIRKQHEQALEDKKKDRELRRKLNSREYLSLFLSLLVADHLAEIALQRPLEKLVPDKTYAEPAAIPAYRRCKRHLVGNKGADKHSATRKRRAKQTSAILRSM